MRKDRGVFGRLFSRNREPREQAFWRWFNENAETYRTFRIGSPEQPALIERLGKELERVHRGLQFELGGDDETGVRELIIGADGRQAVFPAVQALVQAAPELPGWKVIAFRQRKDLNTSSLQINEVTYGHGQLWFSLRTEGAKIGLDLYLEGIDDPKSQLALMVSFLLLDCALGEYDVETRVGTINVEALPPEHEARGLKPFLTLPEEFDALYQLMHGTGA